MASRAKSKRLASGSSSSQPSVGKSYSSRHAAKGTPPAVFAPMGNYNRSSLSSTEGGAGSAVKAEVTTSTRKPKKGADDIIDLCSDEEVSSEVNSSLSDDSPSGTATRSTAGSTGSSGRPSRYATRGLASANKENRAAPLSRKSPSPRGTPAIATPQTPASVASSTLSRTPATRTPIVTSSGYGNMNTGGSRVVHSPAVSSGIPTPSILSSIVSEAGSLGRPPRSRRSSLGGRRIETEGGIDEAQEEEEEAEAHVEEEEPQVEVEEVEVDNDEGLHADTVLLKASMRELMVRLEDMGEHSLVQDAKASLKQLFNDLKNKPEAAVFVARDASAIFGRLLDLMMPRMRDDEEDITQTRRQSVARGKARMSVAPEAYDTPTGKLEHASEADAALEWFKAAVADFKGERRLVTKREAELAKFQQKTDAYKADLDASASLFATKVCVLESRLAELTEALRAKDIEAQQLYETSYVPKTSMGPDAWRPAHQEDIQDIASQGLGLLEEMDGLQADVECTGAWLALLSFTRDTLVNAFLSTHKHTVDELMDFEKESLEKLKTESASELVKLSEVVLEAFAAAQSLKAAALAESEDGVAVQMVQIDRVRRSHGIDQVHAAEETLTVLAQGREKLGMELGTLRSEMQELAENDMKDQYAEACRRVAQKKQQAGEGKGEQQGEEDHGEDGGDEDDTPEMRNCLIM